MTDPGKSKAEELLNDIDRHGELSCFDDGVELLVEALRTARNEAIEEAAKVAEECPDSGISTMDDVENNHAAKIAHAIRSLSSHPAGGHDGG